MIVTVAAAVCARWPVPTALAERWLGATLQRTVHIAPGATVCLCPRPTLNLPALEIGPPEWSDLPRFARVEDAEIRVVLASLLRGSVRIAALTLGRGEVALERDVDGRASWQFARSDGVPDGAPILERLEARDMSWTLRDPARAIDLAGTLSVVDGAGRPDGAVSTEPPRLQLHARGTLRGLPTTARIEGGSVLTTVGPRRLAASVQVGDGRLDFDGEVDELASFAGLRGSFDVRGPALAALGGLLGAVLPRTPPFRLRGTLHHEAPRWRIALTDGQIGSSDLRGEVSFMPTRDATTSRLDGRLDSTRMRISDLGRSIGFGEDRRQRGTVLPDVALDLPSLQRMDATIALRIERLELGSAAPITGLSADLRLESGVLALGTMKATLAGGRVTGDLRLDATTKPGRLDVALKMREIVLERWLPRLRGEPPVSARMNAELELSGRGDSVASVLGRADGRVRAAIGSGTASRLALEVAGLDVAETLAVLATGDRAVRLDCGLADWTIVRGVARPTVMLIDTEDTLLTGEGRIDLSNEQLALRVSALPHDFSPLTLRSPINVGGTFANPTVSADRTRVAATVIASAVLGALIGPLAAVLPLLDFGDGASSSACGKRLMRTTPSAPTRGQRP